jgi:hypothetical protein
VVAAAVAYDIVAAVVMAVVAVAAVAAVNNVCAAVILE